MKKHNGPASYLAGLVVLALSAAITSAQQAAQPSSSPASNEPEHDCCVGR